MAPFSHEGESADKLRFVGPLKDYISQSTRIAGYGVVTEFPDHAPSPLSIVGHEVFEEFVRTGEISEPVTQQLTAMYEQIRREHPEKGVYIGRGFYVPGIEAPNGPRTAAILDKDEFIRTVELFYQYAIDQGYNVPGADIALVIHPFINAAERRDFYGNMAISPDEQLPWTGGYIVPNATPGAPNQVLIGATFGSDEATTSMPHDRFTVDPDRRTVTSKEISIKSSTIVSRTGTRYEIVSIPHRYQNEQALTDGELLWVAEEAQKVFSKYPHSRIEFMVANNGVLYFREIAPYTEENIRDMIRLQPGEEITSAVVKITTAKDVERVIGPNAIVFFGPEAFQDRSTDLFTQVAVREGVDRLICLVHGTLETSHAARILLDAGHSVILVGDKEFMDGSRYRVLRQLDNGIIIEPLDPYAEAIIPFSDVKGLQRGEAGMKVARLAIMKDFGIPVPDGFGIRSEIIWKYLEDIKVAGLIAQLDAMPIGSPRLNQLLLRIQRRILQTSIPGPLREQIQEALTTYGFAKWAIRSSGNEDGEKRSNAGLYESYIDVDPDNVEQCIRHTIASYFSKGSIMAVRAMDKRPYHMVIGVGVQEYVPSGYGMVIFTDEKEMRFEIKEGSPEDIVSGTATDALRVKLSREEGSQFKIIDQLGSLTITIPDDVIYNIAQMTVEIEELFRSHQDIELLLTLDGRIVVVQARPL